MNRISTFQMFQQGIDKIVDHQARLAATDLRLAAGKRILAPSDDPSGAVRIQNLNTEIAHLSQLSSNINNARTRLAEAETVLGQAGNVMQRFSELVVQAGNESLGAADKKAIGHELAALRQQFVSLANSQNVSGDYLFSGFQSNTRPFVQSGNVIGYNGDQGTQQLNVGSGIHLDVSDDGFSVFQDIRTGNGEFAARASDSNTGTAFISATQLGTFTPDDYVLTFDSVPPGSPLTFQVEDGAGATIATGTYTEGDTIAFNGVELTITGQPVAGDTVLVEPSKRQDVFTTMQRAIDLVNGDVPGGNASAVFRNGMHETMENLDLANIHLLEKRAGIGARMNSLDAQQSLHDDTLLNLRSSLSEVQDLDIVEAINELNVQRASLQAAQQAYLQIKDLSIFSFL